MAIHGETGEKTRSQIREPKRYQVIALVRKGDSLVVENRSRSCEEGDR